MDLLDWMYRLSWAILITAGLLVVVVLTLGIFWMVGIGK